MDNLATTLRDARLSAASPSSPTQAGNARRFSDAGSSSAGAAIIPFEQGTRTIGNTLTKVPQPVRAQPQSIPQHKCSLAVCSMATVFGTIELLELILSFLEDPRDVLQLQRTCKQWDSLIREAPQLRVQLFVLAQWNRDPENFQLLNLKIPGLQFSLGEPVDMGQWIEIRMSEEAARFIVGPDFIPGRRRRARSVYEGLKGGLGTAAEISSRSRIVQSASSVFSTSLQYEQLLVAQPPVLGMQAFVSPAAEREDDPEDDPCAVAKLACDAGMTLGFLAETALSLVMAEGKTKSDRDSSGGRVVIYKAIISFCSPIVALRRRSQVRSVTRIG